MASVPPRMSPRCLRCDAPTAPDLATRGDRRGAAPPVVSPEEISGCAACAEWPRALRWARAVTEHRPPADALIHALKYEGWRSVASELAGQMARLLETSGSTLDVPRALIPIPTTPSKVRSRGYNQAGLLAEAVSRRTGIPVLGLLERPEGVSSQIELGRDARRNNVSGAFVAAPEALRLGDPSGRWVLVDDVLTTGATAGAAAEVLEGCGIRDVDLLVWARTPAAREDFGTRRVPTEREFRFIDRRS
jgi:predicted amidophosphoribosyltransferase